MNAGVGQAPHAEPAGIARAIAQLALTMVFALAGLWAAVSLAGPRGDLVEPSAQQLPGPRHEAPASPELRQVDAMPAPAVIFLVGSEEARRDLGRSLELEAAIRVATQQQALDASVAVVASDEQAEEMKAAAEDATLHDGVVTAVDIIDLR